MSQKKWNHLFDIGFSVESVHEDAAKVTGRELRDGLLRRIASMEDAEFLEACSDCGDSFEVGQ